MKAFIIKTYTRVVTAVLFTKLKLRAPSIEEWINRSKCYGLRDFDPHRLNVYASSNSFKTLSNAMISWRWDLWGLLGQDGFSVFIRRG